MPSGKFEREDQLSFRQEGWTKWPWISWFSCLTHLVLDSAVVVIRQGGREAWVGQVPLVPPVSSAPVQLGVQNGVHLVLHFSPGSDRS